MNRRCDVPPLEESHARLVPVPGRHGVDDDSAAERRLAAQDDVVAAGGDDRRVEPELRKPPAKPHDACEVVRRPDVHLDAGAVFDRRDLLEGDVETVRDRVLPRHDERLAAPGRALDVDALFAAGWPGEKAHPDSSTSRVYVAISTLRKAGLKDVLLRRDDGYLFDPDVALRRV